MGQVWAGVRLYFSSKRKEDRVGTHKVYLVGKPFAGPEFLGFENSDDMFCSTFEDSVVTMFDECVRIGTGLCCVFLANSGSSQDRLIKPAFVGLYSASVHGDRNLRCFSNLVSLLLFIPLTIRGSSKSQI